MPFRLLAGPIVRRVEPRSVSIWVALDAVAKVTVSIWADLQTHGVTHGQAEFTASADTLRIGDKLHLALVTVSIPDNEPPFDPARAYSYNVSFAVAGEPNADLSTLNLLQGDFALGYEPEALPSFVLPPEKLTDLRLLNGSCRAPHPDFPDAMRWVDDLILTNRTDPLKRPHQLFLTGDQIYADSVDIHVLHMLMNSAKELLGQTELIPTHPPLHDDGPIVVLPCDANHFPPDLRGNVVELEGKLTSGESGQLLSFGEYCAMYLFCWSDVLWPQEIPIAKNILPDRSELPHEIWQFHTGLGMHKDRLIRNVCEGQRKKGDDFTLEAVNEILECRRSRRAEHEEKTLRALNDFRSGLPKVRRAMANVATYMMLDDHEITDDLNLTESWIVGVRASELGRTIMRNGLLAYTLFQGWGNDPKAFVSDVPDVHGVPGPSPQKRLLDLATKLFPAGDTDPPDSAVADEIDPLLGLSEQVGQLSERMSWHYSVTGPHHIVFVLDTRTHRRFETPISPPGNVSDEALKLQIPDGPRPNGIDVVFVISTLPVLGPPVFDSLFAPLSFRIADFIEHVGSVNEEGDRPRLPGANPDAIEAWAFDDHAFENLLQRLEPYGRVVFISGDVHYATGAEMSYWKKGLTAPVARFVQFTCSALRRDFSDKALMAGQSFAFMQHLIRANIGAERVAWKKKDPEPLSIPAGHKPVPPLRALLRNEPVLLPTAGWPNGTDEKDSVPPDWAWRMNVLSDGRPDTTRPDACKAAPLFPGHADQDIELNIDGYRQVVLRHREQLNKLNFTRVITWATNLGLVRFEISDNDRLFAVHDLYSINANATLPQGPEVYMQHRAALDADESETRPTIPPTETPHT